MTEEQAKKTYERAMKMEQEFGEYFTGILQYFSSLNYIYKYAKIFSLIILSIDNFL